MFNVNLKKKLSGIYCEWVLEFDIEKEKMRKKETEVNWKNKSQNPMRMNDANSCLNCVYLTSIDTYNYNHTLSHINMNVADIMGNVPIIVGNFFQERR